MNLNSPSANSSDIYSQRLADIVGTVIAVITLTLPVFIIAHYSSANFENNQPSLNYTLFISRNIDFKPNPIGFS